MLYEIFIEIIERKLSYKGSHGIRTMSAPRIPLATISFAHGLNFYKLFWVFVIGCFLGVVIETIWCIIRNRRIESRKGLIYGPFNLVYGIGAIFMTVGLIWMKDTRDLFVFIGGTIIGGAYEYVCSVIQEKLTGTISWDYKALPFNLHGRINLLYCFFWGILGLLWERDLYPPLSRLIERIPNSVGIPLTWILVVFFVLDSFISAAAVYRMNCRQTGQIKEHTRFWQWIDRRYPDKRMRRIYPNMKFNLQNIKIPNKTELKEGLSQILK